jgi:hypothetical protein
LAIVSAVDRSDRCYRCGEAGHVAGRCEGDLKCPLCADLGRPAGHRFGGPACTPPPEVKENNRRRAVAVNPRCSPATQTGDAEKSTSSVRGEVLNMEVEEGPGPSQQRVGSSLEEAMDTTH